MKKRKTIFLILLILGNSIPLSGCWNYREINKLAVVSGAAIDKSSDGKQYLMTAEIIDLRGGAKETKIQSKRIEMEGKTLFDAARNIIKVSGKKLYWGHADVFVISEDVAREGILPVIDYIMRSTERRLTINILVSKEKTAKELLAQQSITTEIRAFEMDEMINSEKRSLSKVPAVDVRDFVNDLTGEGVSATLPTVGITNSDGVPTSELAGTAVFDRDKLVGFLNEEETKYLLFVKNKIKGGGIPLTGNSGDLQDGVALEIVKNKTKASPVYLNKNLTMNIDINTEVTLTELGFSHSPIDKKGREKIDRKAEETVKYNIENVIRKVQTDFAVDVFGFGNIVQREMPSVWKSIEVNWNEIFRALPVNVNVKMDIKNAGLLSKSIEVGD